MGWTDEQIKVIESIDDNTLVSASAGSGKTTVMLERLMRIIVGDKEKGRERVPLKNIVTVTFTEAVAAELKSKIGAKLVKLINTGVCDNDYLREQIEDIPLANISTLHGFCSNLIKTHFEVLGIDPSFSISDDDERKILFDKAIDKVMKKYKSQYDYDMDVLQAYFGGEGDFYETLKKIYEFTESQLDREEFLDKISTSYIDGDFATSPLALQYLEDIRNTAIDYLVEGNKKSDDYELIQQDKFVNHIVVHLNTLSMLTSVKDVRDLCEKIKLLPESIQNIPNKNTLDEVGVAIQGEYSAYNNKCKEFYNKLKNLFSSSYDEIVLNLEKNGLYIKKITNLIKEISDEYSKLKKKENKFDFADLEYYAVKLLKDDAIAKELSQKFKYICVDEYQDINAVQEFIITRLSNGKNLFMVGDVKQSIYQFRMTDPDIFLSKYDNYKKDNTLGKPFSLNSNHRSCGEVLDFVNRIFDVIMTKKCGGIDYKNECELRRGVIEFAPQNDSPIRIATFVKNKVEHTLPVEKGEVYSVRESAIKEQPTEYDEGLYIAKEILSLVQHGQIEVVMPDNKTTFRKIKFSDIAILCTRRSPEVERIIQTLQSAGIPVDSSNIIAKKTNPSIQLIVDLLYVIDNHLNDIPLTSVLSSVFGGLTYKEIAHIRKVYPKEKFFHNAVLAYAHERDDEIAKKLKAFFAMLEKYRFASGFMTVSEFMRRILIDFDYEVYLLTKEGGRSEFMGLQQFIGLIEGKSFNSSIAKFAATVTDVENFCKVSGDVDIQGDYVRTNTVHSSKGLEYPVVFIVTAEKQVSINNSVYKALYLMDKNYGITIKDINEQTRCYEDSLPMIFLKNKKIKDLIEEYMRLFYVAVTRAKNRLYITATSSKAFGESYTNDVKSIWGWLNNIAVQDESFKNAYEVKFDKEEIDETEETVRIHTFDKPDAENVNTFIEYFDKDYAHEEATSMPVKFTVTAVNNKSYEASKEKKGDTAYDEQETFKNFIEESIEEMRADRHEGGVDMGLYAEEGTAYHRVMECIDFDCYTVKDVQDSMDRMVQNELLTKAQSDLVDPRIILDCLNDKVISLARRYPHYREKQFMLNIPAKELVDTKVEDSVLLQGTVDLFINGREKGGENILVDFKFSQKSDSEIKERYQKQLDLYAMAIEECMNTVVDKKIIFVLGRNREIEM